MNAPSPVWSRNFSRRASDSVVAELPRSNWSPRQIGARWSTGHAIDRDPVSGLYEELNPPMGTEAENVQRALLTQQRNNRPRYWLGWALLMVGVYVFYRVMQ